MFELILYSVSALYFIFIAVAIVTENLKSAVIFKLVPGVLGIMLAFKALSMSGLM